MITTYVAKKNFLSSMMNSAKLCTLFFLMGRGLPKPCNSVNITYWEPVFNLHYAQLMRFSPTFSTVSSPLRRCYSEVLQVLCRCLCLPIWRENDSEAVSLAQDIQRFFDIYERNLDRDLVLAKSLGLLPGCLGHFP